MKTSELLGAALDWAVAKSEGFTGVALESRTGEWYTPSTYWAQGGPIIERESIQISRVGDLWEGWVDVEAVFCKGPTPLIAAMRCYVASKLGDEVEIPHEIAP
jgi:hypothetical protein